MPFLCGTASLPRLFIRLKCLNVIHFAIHGKGSESKKGNESANGMEIWIEIEIEFEMKVEMKMKMEVKMEVNRNEIGIKVEME